MRTFHHIPAFALLAFLSATGAHAQPRDARGARVVADVDGVVTEARVALVIGNGHYPDAPLQNPVNDAGDVAAALRKLRFEVTLATDVDQERMEDSIRAFGKRLANGGVGLFYYAGHGMQVDGRNFLIPVGAMIKQESDVKYKAVDLGQVLDEFASANNRVNILILDACRDNPFRGVRGAGTRGLAKTDAPRGTIVAYATAPGSVAADGSGRNGMYTQQLLNVLPRAGLAIEQVFKEVRLGVLDASAGAQTPWESSSLTGNFVFTPAVAAATETPTGAVAPAGPPPLSGHSSDEVVRSNTRRWGEWQIEMGQAEKRAEAFERAPNPADLKAQMWEGFANEFVANNPYSPDDDKARANAARRAAYWRSQQQQQPKPMAVDDLEQQAKQRRDVHLKDMRAGHDAATAYEQKPGPPDLKTEAWRRFMETFADDIPGETQDDELRASASKRLAYWKTQKLSVDRPFGLEDLGDPKGAARATLERYRTAYQARDLAGLSAVWAMNHQQRDSMKQLFGCADRVSVELVERAVDHDGDMVAIDFDQRLDFAGSRCLMAASKKLVPMTAVIMRGGSGWMISSILPRRSGD